MSTLQTVHVRVNDAATGQPTPVRIRFTGPDGTYYAPFGRLTEFATGCNVDVGGNLDLTSFQATGRKYCYIDGTCEIRLPVGAIKVEIHKGPEYTPLIQEIQLTPGKLALRLAVQRWIDFRCERWHSGDIRAHYLAPHAALLEGAAEGLAVVNLLARMTFVQDLDAWGEVTPRTPCAFPNLLAFSGQGPALEMSGCMVVVNTLNWHHRLGSLGLLNCHRIVYPLTFGGPWEAFDDWSLADWCDQCHRKNGLVVWAQTDFSDGNYGETLADLILGKVDAVEVVRLWPAFSEGRKFDWYGLLNCGFRVSLVGSSEKDANNMPLGAVRTYVRLQPDQEFNYGTWIEGIRAGRTFVTTGPLLLFTVNGNNPGAVLTVTHDEPIQVQAECCSADPVERLEVLANGIVVAEKAVDPTTNTACLETEVKLPRGGWLAARCWGKGTKPCYFGPQPVYAHTSPVYVQADGQPSPVDRTAVQSFIGHLDKTLDWVNREGRYQNDAQRERLAGIFQTAREVLVKRASAAV